ASRTLSAGCVFVIATSSISSTAQLAFAAACPICSRTRSRFSAIEVTQDCRAGAPPANSVYDSKHSSALSTVGGIADTHDMRITQNIGMLLLAIYLIAVGILTLTGLGIGIVTGVLALLAGIFILIGR